LAGRLAALEDLTMTTIRSILDSIPGRSLPKCPLTFLVYEPGQIVPSASTMSESTEVSEDCILHAIESNETFAHDGTRWNLVGTTANDLATLLMTELVK
jgi:hypothetical protein